MSQPPYPQQHDPGSQNPGDQNPGYQNPGYPYPGGQQPAGQYPGGQYPGYQNAPAPPSGYGYGGGGMPPQPAGWGAQPPQQPVSRPTTVTYAIAALVANLAFGLVAAILVLANQDAYIDQALRDAGLDPSSGVSSDVVGSAYTAGVVIGLVFAALWGLFTWFAWKGHNWARIVIWVLCGLSIISALFAFGAPVGSIVVINVISLLLILATIVLLAVKPSNDWYRYQGQARTYGWPGRA